MAFVVLWAASAPYPMYIQFRYQPGVEYDITSNASFIQVQSAHETPLHFYIPPECNGDILRAKKIPPHILLEISCEDDEIQVREMVMVV